MVNLWVNSPLLPSASIPNIFKIYLTNSFLWTEVVPARAYHVCYAWTCKASLDWNCMWVPPSCCSRLYQRALVWVRIQKLSCRSLRQNPKHESSALITCAPKPPGSFSFSLQTGGAEGACAAVPEWDVCGRAGVPPPLLPAWCPALLLKSPCSSVKRRLCYRLRG